LRGHPQRTWEGHRSETPKSKTKADRRPFTLPFRTKSSASTSSFADNPSPDGGSHGTNKAAGAVFWPQEFLAHDMPDAWVWTYGYNADVMGVFQASNKNSVHQHGQDLAVQIEREIKDEVGLISIIQRNMFITLMTV